MIRKMKDQKLEVTQGQLLGMATPAFRRRFVEEIIPRRVPLEPGSMRVLSLEMDDTEEREVDALVEELGEEYEYMHMDDLPAATFVQYTQSCGVLPAGAIVLEDPYEQYLENLDPGEKPKVLISARESADLKAVYPLINGNGYAECLMDSGSQVISMASKQAEELGLTWDPELIIRMQSANKQVEASKGLARNVPFLFGDMTIYLQIHVMIDPAYEVLLGKPFEILTEANTKTRADGSVELTLTDPVSKRKLVVPTYDKGQVPRTLQKEVPKESEQQSFQKSMS